MIAGRLQRRKIMSFSSWLRNCRCAVARRTQTSRRQRAGFRPRLETLEDRLTPSTAIVQTNLASDNIVANPAQVQDANLVNPWGLAASPTGAWWIANEGTGASTLYNTANSQASVVPLVVNVPGNPTGIVYHDPHAGGFNISENGGTPASSVFLFASVDGGISGWSPNVDGAHAVVAVPTHGGLYLGLAIANDHGHFLYAADFLNNKIDVYDRNFQLVTNHPDSFTDARLPANYHPFNIQAIKDKLYVEYAPADKILAGTAAPGDGAIDVYNTDGHLEKRLILPHDPHLNQPWAVVLAPGNFGGYSNDLLVGNFGDGTISAFNRDNGHFDGQLKDAGGQTIAIRHLWGLAFGNGGAAGPKNTLYFPAGLTSNLQGIPPFHGLFGSLQVANSHHGPDSSTPSPAVTSSMTPASSLRTATTAAPSGLPYPTAAAADQLVADINYVNTAGGRFTLHPQAGRPFGGVSVGGGGDLTIRGNG